MNIKPNPPSRDRALADYIAKLERRLQESIRMTQGFTDLEAARSDAQDDLMREVIDDLKEIYLL